MGKIFCTIFLGAILGTALLGGCGQPPVKPVVPVGCKDLKLECQCDEHGKDCRWIWICEK